LDRLGQIYLALDRTSDAVRVLRKAAQLAPRDSTTLLHLGRALLKAGQKEEASAAMARFRELGSSSSSFPHPAGLIDFLSLSPEEQYARYKAGVERTVRNDPSNVEGQVELLKLKLNDGKTDQAAALSRQIIALKPSAALLADAAGALLKAQQYATAKEFVDQAVGLAGSSADLALDLALASFHVMNPQAGLEQLDRIPEAHRTGDYYLARAQMLDAAGKPTDAITAVNQGLTKAPSNAELYRDAALLLIRNHRVSEALRLLDQATHTLPDDPELLLLRASTLELARKKQAAERR